MTIEQKIEEKTNQVIFNQIININKPLHWTSFDVCNYLKRKYPKKTKIGHAGTLDPLATGILLVAIGKATKNIECLQNQPKTYIATITLGANTPTYDAEFYPEIINNTSDITKEQIIIALQTFVGTIDQIPPIYSAIKVSGKRSYDLARIGQIVELKSRKVTIYHIELQDFKQEMGITTFVIEVKCAKGTYIRSLAYDLGKKLGTGAFLAGLIRTRIGEYSIKESIDLPN